MKKKNELYIDYILTKGYNDERNVSRYIIHKNPSKKSIIKVYFTIP